MLCEQLNRTGEAHLPLVLKKLIDPTKIKKLQEMNA